MQVFGLSQKLQAGTPAVRMSLLNLPGSLCVVFFSFCESILTVWFWRKYYLLQALSSFPNIPSATSDSYCSFLQAMPSRGKYVTQHSLGLITSAAKILMYFWPIHWHFNNQSITEVLSPYISNMLLLQNINNTDGNGFHCCWAVRAPWGSSQFLKIIPWYICILLFVEGQAPLNNTHCSLSTGTLVGFQSLFTNASVPS